MKRSAMTGCGNRSSTGQSRHYTSFHSGLYFYYPLINCTVLSCRIFVAEASVAPLSRSNGPPLGSLMTPPASRTGCGNRSSTGQSRHYTSFHSGLYFYYPLINCTVLSCRVFVAEASVAPLSRSNGPPLGSLMTPPASRTRSTPAATSQALEP